LLSVTEGDDKPAKYPVMFRAADAVVLSKNDLLPVMDDFDPLRAERYLRELANTAPVLSVAARKKIDIDAWLVWLEQEIKAHHERLASGKTIRPNIQPDGMRLHSAG